MLEFVYTSVRSGLKSGNSGFTFAAWTRGAPPHYLVPLENISGYKPVWQVGDIHWSKNPISYSYRKVQYGALTFPVFSRIATTELDYTGRSNKIAHHIIPESEEELLSTFPGPIGAFFAEQNFYTSWSGESKLLCVRKLQKPSQGCLSSSILRRNTWKKWKADSLWANVVADRLTELLQSDSSEESLYLEYSPGFPAEDVLNMVAEVIGLLDEKLWKECTFDTYFIQPQIGVQTRLLCGFPDNPVIRTMKKLKPETVITLDKYEPLPEQWKKQYSSAAETVQEIHESEIVLPVPEHKKSIDVCGDKNMFPEKREKENLTPLEQCSENKTDGSPSFGNNNQRPKRSTAVYVCLIVAFIVVVSVIIVFREKIFSNCHSCFGKIEIKEENRLKAVDVPFIVKQNKIDTSPEKQKISNLEKNAGNRNTQTQLSEEDSPLEKKGKKFVLHSEKDSKAGRDLFLKLNRAVSSMEKGQQVLYRCKKKIQEIELLLSDRKIKGGGVLAYPQGNDKIFKLYAEGNILFFSVENYVVGEPEKQAMRQIKEIRIYTTECCYLLPFGIDTVIDEIQPKVEIQENLSIIATDRDLYKDNSLWITWYLTPPTHDRSMFSDLRICIENVEKERERYSKAKAKTGRMVADANKLITQCREDLLATQRITQKEYCDLNFCSSVLGDADTKKLFEDAKKKYKGTHPLEDSRLEEWRKRQKKEKESKKKVDVALTKLKQELQRSGVKADPEDACSKSDVFMKKLRAKAQEKARYEKR